MLSVCLYVVYMLESVKHQEQYTRNISAYDENAWYSKAVTAGDIKRRVQWLDIMAVNRTRLEISAPFPKEKLGLTRHVEGKGCRSPLINPSFPIFQEEPDGSEVAATWQSGGRFLRITYKHSDFWVRLFFGGFTLQFPQAEPICLVLAKRFLVY